jgi:hypothetical protein
MIGRRRAAAAMVTAATVIAAAVLGPGEGTEEDDGTG